MVGTSLVWQSAPHSGDAKRALPLLEAAEKDSAPRTTGNPCINEKEKEKDPELLRQAREKLTALPDCREKDLMVKIAFTHRRKKKL